MLFPLMELKCLNNYIKINYNFYSAFTAVAGTKPCNSCVTLPLASAFQLGNGTAHTWIHPSEHWGWKNVTGLSAWRGALQPWELNSSSASVLWSSDTCCSGDEWRDVSTCSCSNVDAGPGGCLWGSSCVPGNCRELPWRPQEGPEYSCKEVRTISVQDGPSQIVPVFSCTFHWFLFINASEILMWRQTQLLPPLKEPSENKPCRCALPWRGCDIVKIRETNCFSEMKNKPQPEVVSYYTSNANYKPWAIQSTTLKSDTYKHSPT